LAIRLAAGWVEGGKGGEKTSSNITSKTSKEKGSYHFDQNNEIFSSIFFFCWPGKEYSDLAKTIQILLDNIYGNKSTLKELRFRGRCCTLDIQMMNSTENSHDLSK